MTFLCQTKIVCLQIFPQCPMIFTDGNYLTWASYFENFSFFHKMISHLTYDAPYSRDKKYLDWAASNSIVIIWILGRITPKILQTISH